MNVERQSDCPARRFRVGIDVGGTFTDVVVIDNETMELVGQRKIPTTHSASEGVARGIIDAIGKALGELKISPNQVAFIAHSTTQATNALLEGDVASVGIVGMGDGVEGFKAKIDTRIPPVELAPGRHLAPRHVFLNSRSVRGDSVDAALNAFRDEGVEVVVASAAFGVDDAADEDLVARRARELGLLATAGHEVSSLYGLRTRTRTAVINAAILPKMIHTATMTDSCVKEVGITAPLMIMRSDGGVMSVGEVHRRPILTMLSGPAAGIAGALMYEKVSDGIFIEVGGTSADISVIRDGAPQMKAARVGGHRTYLNTLDVRTLAIAGGSMLRERNGSIVDVGSRSAHIAGLGYACFQRPEVFDGAKLVHISPTAHDSGDYVAVECVNGERFALTPTCAANLLGMVPVDAFAFAPPDAAAAAFVPLSDTVGSTVEEVARRVLEIACSKVVKQVEALIDEYGLDRETIELVGGGGGSASLVPFAASIMGVASRLARNAEVISTIGVALAMVRDSVERNVVDATPQDVLEIRREAVEAVCRIGALPETVEVDVEVDTKRNLLRATAFGTTEMKRTDGLGGVVEDPAESAARSMKVRLSDVKQVAGTAALRVFTAERRERYLGFLTRSRRSTRVVDSSGVVRLQRSECEIVQTSAAQTENRLSALIASMTDFGDAGRTLPEIHLLVGSRIVNLSGLADAEQVRQLACAELEHLPSETDVVVLGNSRD